MSTVLVDIFHDPQADPSLDDVNGPPPPTAVLAGGYNGKHRLDPATITAALATFTTLLKGLVPAPGTADGAHFMNDQGAFLIPPGTGGGTSDGVFRTLNLGPFIAPPDIGPGSIDSWNPWTAAGGTLGDHSIIATNTSILGATVNGLVPTRTNDVVVILVGGDGHGYFNLGHMASAVNAHKIYCPSNKLLQLSNGGGVLLFCLNQSDHGWRVVAACTGSEGSLGAPLAVSLGTGPTHNWNPAGAAGARRWHVSVPTGGATISGINRFPDGVNPYKAGTEITLVNYGDGLNNVSAILKIQDFRGSATGNKVLCPQRVSGLGTGANDVTVPLYGVIRLVMDEFSFEPFTWMIDGPGL